MLLTSQPAKAETLLSLVFWQISRVELSRSLDHGKSSLLAGPVFLRTFVFIRSFRVLFISTLSSPSDISRPKTGITSKLEKFFSLSLAITGTVT